MGQRMVHTAEKSVGRFLVVALRMMVLQSIILTGCTGSPVVETVADQAATPAVFATATASTTPSPTIVVSTPTATMSPTATSSATPTATILASPSAPRPTSTTTSSTVTVARQYVFPIQPADVASYGPCHHDYPASDIFAPIGSQFVAVTDGIVDYVSHTDTWTPQNDKPAKRGGLSIAIIGSESVRYYGSHLSQIADGIDVGSRVKAGDLLGLTGNSGNARHTDPHLHFGISRPTTPDDWQVRRGEVNPYPYLNAWREGDDLQPELGQPKTGVC